MCAYGRLFGLLAAAVTVSLLHAPLPSPQPAGSPAASAATNGGAAPTRHAGTYGQLPLHFEHNQGQIDADVRFLARGSGYSLFLTSSEAVLALKNRRLPAAAVVRMKLAGANPGPAVTGRDELPGKANYFVGHDTTQWRTNIPTYERVHYNAVYPGIDLTYYGNQGQLEYDFLVAPGADPGRITMSFDGARDIRIDPDGDLILGVAGGNLRQHTPVVYQDVQGARHQIAARYVMKGKQDVGFELGDYDETLPLVIDPILTYATYLGGDGLDTGHDIAVDADGYAYVTGETGSTNFPATSLAFDPDPNGGTDVFVTKLDPTGSTLIYSSYLGGSANETGSGIAVDASGSVYVTGLTFSLDFPLVGAFDTTRVAQEAFVTKLAPTGSRLVYSSFLGGSGADAGNDIAVDAELNAYVTGQTFSADFPLRGFDTTRGGTNDAFVTKVNAAGAGIAYSTYLGGANTEIGRGIAVDALFTAYVTGQTMSTDFPITVRPFDSTLDGVRDAFVTRVDPAGAALVYSTYLGGTNIEDGNDIAVDAAGNAHVTGQTFSSTGFPVTPGAVQPTLGGNGDAFVTTFTGTGELASSTYLGGAGTDNGFGIAVDRAGTAHVTGETRSTNFPVTPDAVDSRLGGDSDAFVTTLDRAAASLVFSTYLGGSDQDAGNGIALDDLGSAYVTGFTRSADFPVTRAFDTLIEGSQDAFVVKIGSVPAFLTLNPPEDTNPVNAEHCVTATVEDAARNPMPRVTVRFTVIGAANTRGSGTTDSNGQVVFCYTGPTAPGTDAISAFADTNKDDTQDASEPGGRAAKTWVAGPPATLTLTPETDTNPVGTQHCVVASVQDVFANATPGITVRFAVTGAVQTGGSTPTDMNGQAMYCYTGPTAPGADAISAFADTDEDGTQGTGEPAGAATKTWVPGSPATLMLTPTASSNGVGEEHCVTATVKDAFANPTPGITVRFQVTGAANTSGAATTGGSGDAAFCYTGPHVTGVDTITAYADTDEDGGWDADEPIANATKTWVAGTPATLTLTPQTDTNPVGTQHCVVASVRDAFANPTSDVTVRFRVTGAASTTGSVATDVNGQAMFCYTGPTAPGLDTIFAFADANGDGAQGAGEPAGAATKSWITSAPATLTLTPAASTNNVGAQHCVTATLKDAFANATPNITVQFEVSGTVNTTTSASTGANGQAVFCYNGPLFPGADVITAYADTDGDGGWDPEEPIASATKTWVAPESSAECRVTGGGYITTAGGSRATFGGVAYSVNGVVKGIEAYVDHGRDTRIKLLSLNVLEVVCRSATEATVFGEAWVNGTRKVYYRLELRDGKEPGTKDTYSILLSDGYTSGERVLEGGNIQIH